MSKIRFVQGLDRQICPTHPKLSELISGLKEKYSDLFFYSVYHSQFYFNVDMENGLIVFANDALAKTLAVADFRLKEIYFNRDNFYFSFEVDDKRYGFNVQAKIGAELITPEL